MHAFVTGATGFIGGRLARLLLKEGWEVTCLVRTPAKGAPLEEAGARLAEGDITDPGTLDAPMRGADAVFHVAAYYALGVRDGERMEAINVGGTRNVLDAMERTGVPRAVYCSSVAALGRNAPGVIGNETKQHDGNFGSVYERTKHDAHRLVRERVRSGSPVVTVMPGAVYGPGDDSLMMTMLRLWSRGLLIGHPGATGSLSMVHVDDVAQGMLNAFVRAPTGDELCLCGDNDTIGNVLRRAAPHVGLRAPWLPIPPALVRVFTPVGPLIARALGQPPGLLKEGLASMTASWMYSSAKAERTIGYRWRPVEEGLPPTIASLRA